MRSFRYYLAFELSGDLYTLERVCFGALFYWRLVRADVGLQAVLATSGVAGGHDDAGAVFAAARRGVAQDGRGGIATGVGGDGLPQVVAGGEGEVEVVAGVGAVGKEGVVLARVQFDFDVRLFARQEFADDGFVREFALRVFGFHPRAVGFHQVVELRVVGVVRDAFFYEFFCGGRFQEVEVEGLAGGEREAEGDEGGGFHGDGVPCSKGGLGSGGGMRHR